MALPTDINVVRVEVLGRSVDLSTWTTSPPAAANGLAASITERILNRAINTLYARMDNVQIATAAFAARFNSVVGDEAVIDKAEFDALGKNIIQAVAELYADGGGGGVNSFIDTYSGADWAVTHNLNRQYVSVQVVDDSGNTIIPAVDYDSATACTLHFTKSVSGTAIIRK